VVRNDAGVVGRKLTELHGALAGLFKHFEIIVVDNFSRDNTGEVLDGLGFPLTVITLPRLHNVQAALTAGVELAVGDFLVEVPDLAPDIDFGVIESLYEACQDGNDFVFLSPGRISAGSSVFYGLMNRYFRGAVSERFVSSVVTLSSRRGQNKASDRGTKMVNRNVSYVLTGLKCAVVKANIRSRNRRRLRDNISLMVDTMIYHTNYVANFAVVVAGVFLLISVAAFVAAIVLFFVMNTANGWASQFAFTAGGFAVLSALLAVVCKYLSHLMKGELQRTYTFSSVERKGSD
jgi:glycosyltransferase involved in cell wall biosynthesis